MARKAGKIIDKIHFNEKGQNVYVDLRLVRDGNAFHYLVDHDDPPIHMSDTDPNKLREKVFADLREKLTINWDPVIVITTNMAFMEHEGGGSSGVDELDGIEGERQLTFDIRGYEVGKDNDGDHIHRYRNLEPSNRRRREYHISTGLPVCRHRPAGDNSSSQAMIPDTPENRLKLKAICDALTNLGQRLTELMDQDAVVKTLDNIRLLGLPAPSPELDVAMEEEKARLSRLAVVNTHIDDSDEVPDGDE